MKIRLEQIGKKFNFDWIFKNINFEFSTANPTAIIGPNGSGKSTLSQIIAGYVTPSAGKIFFENNTAIINNEEIFKQIAVCSPHTELFEELTLLEIITFYGHFKPFINNYQTQNLIEISGLKANSNKHISDFSSGMKQRIKLLLTLCSDVPILILDEPCSNLDNQGIEWYKNLISNRVSDALIIVASNAKEYEYGFCKNILQLNIL